MNVQPLNQAVRSAPPLGSALANIAAAAHQRAFALNLSTVEQMMSRGVQRADDNASGADATTRAIQAFAPPLFTSQPLAEPAFRYAAEMLRIYQNAASAMAELLTAQTRGEQRQIEALTEEARHQVDEAATTAVTAAQSVINTGMEVVNRVTHAAAQAGQSLGMQAVTQPEETGRAAVHPNGRRVQRAEGEHAKRH
jgi:hypothetical protein